MSLDAALQHAAALHQAGRLDQAEPIYRQVLAAQPNHGDTLHLLGVLLHQRGESASAIVQLRKAVAAAPAAAAFHNSLGNVLRAAADPTGAAAAYRQAARLQPNVAVFHQHLGMALRDAGDPVGAERALRQALRLDRASVGARIELTNLLVAFERWTEAVATIEPACRQMPDDPVAANAHGIALAGAGRPEQAVDAFGRAVAIRPDYATAWFNQANSLVVLERFEEAVTASAAALRLAPDDTDILAGHLRLLLRTKDFVALEGTARHLLGLERAAPSLVALQHLGQALAGQDRAAEALHVFRLAAETTNDPIAWHMTGLTLRDLGDWAAAEPCFARAAGLAPDEPGMQADLGYAMIANGRIAEAWPYFEGRTILARNLLTTPRWDGAPTDKTVLVHTEQGSGDVIQFARFLPIAGQRARIVFVGGRPLRRLMAALPDVAEIVTDASPPAHDLHAPIMSLPGLLGVAPDRLADMVPYLSAPPEVAAVWGAKLAALRRPRVGVVWAGNPDYPADRRRSIPFDVFAPLLDVHGCSFVSLQVGAEAGRCAEKAFDASPMLTDFADTAGAIASLDLTISVDTSVAHLAGALGRPVWLLNRADTDWRWMTGRTDSPWYPTMRIFRQTRPGRWPPVIAAVRAALEAWVA